MSKTYLLLGAGFTKNFGGYLASEMWSHIFNDRAVQTAPALREMLLSDQDFESVYHKVVSSGNNEQIQALSVALMNAYEQLDQAVSDFTFAPGSPYPVNIYKVQKLLAAFSGKRGDPGYIFTLNQDLFLERHYLNGPRPLLPGIRQSTEWFSSALNTSPKIAEPVELMTTEQLAETRSNMGKYYELLYLKLHGSFNWGSSVHPSHMIIGRDKSIQIERNPLLQWYFEMFRTCLAVDESRLLVIGYGFGDPHINNAISNAIGQNGLSVYLIDPTPAAEIIKRIRSLPQGDLMLQAIKAFYTIPLRELFPGNQAETTEWNRIQENFFERRVM